VGRRIAGEVANAKVRWLTKGKLRPDADHLTAEYRADSGEGSWLRFR